MKRISILLACISIACIHAASPEVSMVADPLETYYSLTGKTGGQPAALRFCGGEAGIAAFSVYNSSADTMYCRIGLTGLNSLKPVIREAVHIRARLGQLPADVLPEISADGVIVIPAGENRQVFIDLPTNAKPGHYHGTFTTTNVMDNTTTVNPLNIEILPLTLPEKHPLSIMTWDCSLRGATDAGRQKILELLTESRVNAFHVLERPELKDGKYDFTELNAMLAVLKGKGLAMLRCAAPPRNINVLTEKGYAEYVEYLKLVIDNVKKQGYGYDDFILYPYDENVQNNFFAAAKASKAADPKVMVYADPTTKATPEEMQRLVDGNYVDYFQYNASFFRDRGDIVKPLMKHVRYNTIYWCPVIQKRLRPHSFYRQMGRSAYRYQLHGVGYWTSLWMADGKSMPWDDFQGKTASPVTIYPGRDNDADSIPSRRWRAFRIGLEDYLFFDLARQKGNVELEKKIDTAVRNPQSFAAANALKNEITNFLMEK